MDLTSQTRIRLDREIDNLRPAVDWSIDTGDSALVCGIIAPVAEVAWIAGASSAAGLNAPW